VKWRQVAGKDLISLHFNEKYAMIRSNWRRLMNANQSDGDGSE